MGEVVYGIGFTLWWTNKKLLKMAIEIVDFPIKHGDFPWQNVSSPEGTTVKKQKRHELLGQPCL